MSKPEINLRFCVAGVKTLIPLFKKSLKSYIKFFKIKELLIYTTDNLYNEIREIAPNAKIYRVHKFYEENYYKFPQSVKDVLDYSIKHNYCHELPSNDEKKLFFERIRFIMDYYLINGEKPFILSDIDVIIVGNIKPIIEWMNSDYILYNADYYDNPSVNNNKMFKILGGEEFFNKAPKFNCGFMCVPKGIKIDIEEVCKYIKYEITSYVSEQTAMAAHLIKNKIKTRLLPRDLMVTKNGAIKNKTLAHLGPYGLSADTINFINT